MQLKQPLILASQSPRRKQLLEQAGFSFDIKVVETDESFPRDMPIPEIPIHIARNKALAVANEVDENAIVLAADTVVVLNNTIIGKPKDRQDAINILTRLSGQTHHVITGVIIRANGQETAFQKTTEVHFMPLTHEQIEFYVDNYKPYDKAGAYAIQEWIGAIGIDKINGCFYNVMGLPISNVSKLLLAL
ncbi:septum formation protein [Chitinophaga skermanii]|uniref:dTTP/UTP pyrophosphatase n=1 Tax=Chitinophaga skermanii TaxID=331697 RepID=A0A327QFG7_9BACT|nr:Maf family protein [Chitinophaga skermanii]RAJ02514.1 septum formation protein [Chitinophaga skermanii]